MAYLSRPIIPAGYGLAALGAAAGGLASMGVAGLMYGKKSDSRNMRIAKGFGMGIISGMGPNGTATFLGRDRDGGPVARWFKGGAIGLGMGIAGGATGYGISRLFRR